MSEREHFITAQTPLGQYRQFIDLELGEEVGIPFTGAEIIYAETDSGSKVVIKKTLHNWQAEHEWIGLNTAYRAGISVPLPVALINYTKDQLAIVSTGSTIPILVIDPNPEVKAEMGRQIKTMHQLAMVDEKMWKLSGRSSFTYYDKYMFNWSRGRIAELSVDSKTAILLSSFAENMDQYCKESKPTFNHNDLHDGQIIVSDNGAPTIIDFGNWIEETWLNDIGYHLFHLIRTDRTRTKDFVNFLNGYCEGKKLSDIEKSNLAFYLLFITSRALTYFYRNRSSYLPTAKETHNKVLAYLEDETIWKSY